MCLYAQTIRLKSFIHCFCLFFSSILMSSPLSYRWVLVSSGCAVSPIIQFQRLITADRSPTWGCSPPCLEPPQGPPGIPSCLSTGSCVDISLPCVKLVQMSNFYPKGWSPEPEEYKDLPQRSPVGHSGIMTSPFLQIDLLKVYNITGKHLCRPLLL